MMSLRLARASRNDERICSSVSAVDLLAAAGVAVEDDAIVVACGEHELLYVGDSLTLRVRRGCLEHIWIASIPIAIDRRVDTTDYIQRIMLGYHSSSEVKLLILGRKIITQLLKVTRSLSLAHR